MTGSLIPHLINSEIFTHFYESYHIKRREEEASFSRTLQKGIERFKKSAGGAAGKVFSGRDAFELYDTYGFPMDLTEVWLLS